MKLLSIVTKEPSLCHTLIHAISVRRVLYDRRGNKPRVNIPISEVNNMCNNCFGNFGDNWWWIIILLILFGNNNGCGDCGSDNNNNAWWIVLLALLGAFNNNGCGCSDNGCGCNNNSCGC